MKKIYKNTWVAIVLPMMALFAACSDDIDPVVESLDFNRLMTPVGTEIRVVNRNSVRLNWTPVRGAEEYTVEFSEDSLLFGAIVRTEIVTAERLPVTFVMSGETQYSVRVKATAAGITDSKWAMTAFKTDAENIFQPINLSDIEATQVTVRWPAGSEATDLVVNPGNITRPVTAGEKEEGQATITGLASETTYTVVLKNGTKTRGTLSFTTLLDLGGAVQVNPDDDLEAILEGASAGDVFALMPGTYVVNAEVAVAQSIAIRGARPADKPVVTGAVFRMSGTAGLQIKDVVIDGTGAPNENQMIIYDAGTFEELRIEDSEITNYVKGSLYVNAATYIESLVITRCIYSTVQCVGGDFIDFRNGLARTLLFTGNTVYNCAVDRDFFRMDAGGSTNFPSVKSIITITNNTFYNASSGSASRRLLYVRLTDHEITFSKNIVANSQGIYSNQAATTVVEMRNNNYFNAPNYLTSTVKDDPANGYTTLDPGFANAAGGNFTVSNETLIEEGIGDPRWLP